MYNTILKHFSHTGLLDANGRSIGGLQRILDIAMIGFVFYVCQPKATWETNFINIPSIYIVMGIVAILLPRAGIYKSYRHKTISGLFKRLNSTWVSIVCFIIFTIFLNKSSADYSRISMALWAVSSWIWLIVVHVFSRICLRRIRENGLNSRTILYWGEQNAAIRFSNEILKNQWLGYRIVAWFSPVELDLNYQADNLPKCGGGLDKLRDWLKINEPNCIVFGDTTYADEKSKFDLFEIFGDTYSRIIYAPNWYTDTMAFEVEYIGTKECIEIWGARQTYDGRLIKRAFDLVFATVGVIIILPLLIIISIAVKLSSNGPIIFKQKDVELMVRYLIVINSGQCMWIRR